MQELCDENGTENESMEDSEEDDGEIDQNEQSMSDSRGNFNENATRNVGHEPSAKRAKRCSMEEGEVVASDDESGIIQFGYSKVMDEDERDQHRFMEKLSKYMEKRDKIKEKEWREKIEKELRKGKEMEEDVRKKKEKTGKRDRNENRGKDTQLNSLEEDAANSEITIYKPAIQLIQTDKVNDKPTGVANKGKETNEKIKRVSSSSEEAENTSDENMNISPNDTIDNIIADGRRQVMDYGKPKERMQVEVAYNDVRRDQPRPHSSRDYQPDEIVTLQDRAAQIIRQAEKARARILEIPGMNHVNQNPLGFSSEELELIQNKERLHSVLVDEGYSDVASHVDEVTRRKIITCEYVDFSKLLPSDKSEDLEDEPMRMVNRDGVPAWAPARDRDPVNSFTRWEQAFRVYSNIYTEVFPRKAAELIQYNHVINTAAQSFTWDNVYRYDRKFRKHLSKFPSRSWSVILQQAWTMCLKDRYGNGDRNRGNDRNKKRRDICWKFNQGKCSYGLSCKFDHRCTLCLKFGHGSHNCRRTKADRDRDYGRNYGQGFNQNYYSADHETGERGGGYNRYHRQERSDRNDRFHYSRKDKPQGNGNKDHKDK